MGAAAGTPPRPTRVVEQASGNSGGDEQAREEGSWAREKVMVINLEFVRAIINGEELLLLEPLRQEVLPFIDQLRHQLPQKSALKMSGWSGVQDEDLQFPNAGKWLQVPEAVDRLQEELPFALEVVCTYFYSSVAELERDAYPVPLVLALGTLST